MGQTQRGREGWTAVGSAWTGDPAAEGALPAQTLRTTAERAGKRPRSTSEFDSLLGETGNHTVNLRLPRHEGGGPVWPAHQLVPGTVPSTLRGHIL